MPEIENQYIPEQYLDQLRAAGLFVSHPFDAFLGGVWIVKPNTTPGNHIPGFEQNGFISLDDNPQCPDSDAPMLSFLFVNGKWQVNGQDCAGGMGPADFIDDWLTPEEAVQDILDFFFGDPTRMQKKAAEMARIN